MNAIGTQLRGPINSGLTRWRTAVLNKEMDAAAVFSLSMEMTRLTRDGTAEPVSRDQILRRNRGQGKNIFPVQLATTRIGNLTRLIHTLVICDAHTYYLGVTKVYRNYNRVVELTTTRAT